ncbi:YicC/YloC family endoribonuclease [Sulfitobacter sp. D35]|uniref:YicC/YloC family endoribonuclease n=1 Tax=Sulfitobacter sp. D35 TaxID=3083252 RepID=UPI00296ED56C|nr:YicC/YloC family endoribonuclease [Sulfitobacter sp. D35]MDW4496525.1 YicC/YloC family endoribonuclease [Sulfitobacter sp. D35]
MLRSMTGFASATGTLGRYNWSWELRSVNGKGLDLRFRVPDWIEGLEVGLRATLASAVKRGNVTCSLRVSRDEAAGGLSLNKAQVAQLLEALATVEAMASEKGVALAPSRASDLLAQRGVMDQSGPDETETVALRGALLAQFATLADEFDTMREAEGKALAAVLRGQLDEVDALVAQAAGALEARSAELGDTLRRNLAKVLDGAEGADPDRVAQELALIAVKSDVTEEIDRLRTHVGAARRLLDEGGAVGRKLDFLMQEFNREANTLCSKSQNAELTQIGLALKVLIDQMREQAQNVE